MNEKYAFELLRETQLYCPGRRIDSSFCSNQWAESIDRLLGARYSFYPCAYSGNSYLFRGIQRGIAPALSQGSFAYFDGDNEMCCVEQVMGVFFVTHELSDALTVSQMFEGSHDDGGILVFRSGVFNDRLHLHQAAVLAVGDSGIVFKYPFLTAPLLASDIAHIFVRAHALNNAVPALLKSKVVHIGDGPRQEVERRLTSEMSRLGITPAQPVSSDRYPRR